MSDLENRNAEATRQALEDQEARIQVLETDILSIRNQCQTLINLVTELQQANTLALAQMRGTGATD